MTVRTQAEAPHINGFPLPIMELSLPESHLNLEKERNWNNHHRQWERRKYGRFILYRTLRDLESTQETVPKDVHALYHQFYIPPAMPSLEAAMLRVDDAYHQEESLKVWADGEYILTPITHSLFRAAVREYEELR